MGLAVTNWGISQAHLDPLLAFSWSLLPSLHVPYKQKLTANRRTPSIITPNFYLHAIFISQLLRTGALKTPRGTISPMQISNTYYMHTSLTFACVQVLPSLTELHLILFLFALHGHDSLNSAFFQKPYNWSPCKFISQFKAYKSFTVISTSRVYT